MRVIVTGANGFIGANLAKTLEHEGFTVFRIDDDYLRNEDWQYTITNELIGFNPEAIFHAGACSDTLETDVQFMMIRNYATTKVLSDWCYENKAAFVYSSSAANYGVNGKNPSNLYGWSKYVAEDYVRLNGGIALRYFNVYGPGESHKGRMASFAYQAYMLSKEDKKVYLFPGNPSRDFIYIDDVISANLHAFQNYHALSGNAFEVSTGNSSTFEEMLDLFGIAYSHVDENLVPTGYQYFTCGDPKKWMQNWVPKYTLERGVEKYLEYLERELT